MAEALKLEPEPFESESQSLLASNHSFNHSTYTSFTDVKSEKVTMEFEPGIVTKVKTELQPVADKVMKLEIRKDKLNPKGKHKKCQCLFCPSKFIYPWKLRRHIKTHTGEAPYICRICLEEFRDGRTFLNHCWKIHNNLSSKAQTKFRKKLFQCNLCDQRCYNRCDLLLHHQTVHSIVRPFSCDICGATFKIKPSLRSHQRSVHGGHKKIYRRKCPICLERFTSDASLRHHGAALHSKESLFCECKLCGKKIFTERELKHHVRRVHEKNFKCKLCGQGEIPTLEEWRQHLKTLHPDDCTFKCSYNGCESTFYTNTKRKSHMLKHTREKPFQCDHCQKSFRVKSSLTRHTQNKYCQKLTRPEKKFKCDYCQMHFSRESELKIHMYVHEKTQPFVCGKCGKGFALKSRLTKHKKTHKQ